MKTTISWTIARYHGFSVEVMSAEIETSPAQDYPHHVVYVQCATADGRDGLSVNGTWFEDKDADDVFCSEMFAALSGKYPYEVRDEVVPSEW